MSRARAPRPKPVSKGEPKVDVLEVARDPDAGWTGRVVDAHDGSPIGKARVAIERPAFRAAEALASTVTGDDGRFELRTAAAERRAGDELVVDAALHASLRQSLPPSGALAIALVSRKRALLGRLVAWARQQGRPFDAKPEPTPAHVRRHAGKDFTLARWADAVERAAFAGGMVDGNVEAEIDRLAPPPLPAAPASPLAPPPSPSGEVADPPSEGRARAHAVPAPADARRDPPPRDAPPRSRT